MKAMLTRLKVLLNDAFTLKWNFSRKTWTLVGYNGLIMRVSRHPLFASRDLKAGEREECLHAAVINILRKHGTFLDPATERNYPASANEGRSAS